MVYTQVNVPESKCNQREEALNWNDVPETSFSLDCEDWVGLNKPIRG